MTTLGSQPNEGFQRFQTFRDRIVNAQSVAEVSKIKADLQPWLDKTPEEGGIKMDLRKLLDNCFKHKEAELYGEEPPKTDMNTQNIPKDMMPKKETVPTQPQVTGAEEVKLPPPPAAPLEGRAKEIAEEMKDIDAENFKNSTPPLTATAPTPPASVPTEPTPTPEKKTRSRTKPTEESTIEYVPRTEKSVKIFRRINVAINGISFTNNEIGYEVIAGTREEALEESKALRESALADIKELNALMKVQPATQTMTPPAPAKVETPAPTQSATIKDANDVFPDANFDAEKVKKAVAAKNPAGLNPGHEFDLYNLERLRALFAMMRSVDDVEVKLPDGSGMLLGTYITEETKKFQATFPVAKDAK